MDASSQPYPPDIHVTARMDQDAQSKTHEGPGGATPQDQAQPPPEPEPHNIRELQLAAQLGHDLANTGLLIHGTSSEMHIESNTDPALRAILPHPPQESNETLHSHIPESEHDATGQAHDYVTETPHPDQMSLAMPMHLEHHHSAGPFYPGETAPRKRSKVSRACDECRRKKVKCDAQLDVGDGVCSGCRRSNIPCLFSRVPQKRGPSKGYIKELADRIGSIEQLVQVPGEDRGTKRSFSTMSAGSVTSSTPVSSRPPVWGSEPRPMQPATTQIPDHYQVPYSPNDLAPQLGSPQPEDTQASRLLFHPETRPGFSSAPGTSREINQDDFDRYLKTIHPQLPFLDERKEVLEAQLEQCPKPLQDAFLETLFATVSSPFTDPTHHTLQAIDQAYRSLVEWELLGSLAPAAERRAVDITYIRTLLLMAVEADNRPPNSSGPSKEAILGRAVSGAMARKLHQSRPRQPLPGGIPDAGDDAKLRIWWVLVVLDRWHAVSTGSHCLIPKRHMNTSPGLRRLLGERFYYLLRFTRVLGPASAICSNLQDPPSPPTPADQELANVLHTWLEEDREELPSHVTPTDFPLVHLAYWHARLLVSLLDPETTSASLLATCRKSLALLISNPELSTPFTHHLTILTTLSLLELTAVDARGEEATSLLSDLRTYPLAPSAWNPVVRATVDEKLSLLAGDVGVQKTARESLQRLADVATARSTVEGNLEGPVRPYSDLGFNPAPILRLGYLSLMREMHP